MAWQEEREDIIEKIRVRHRTNLLKKEVMTYFKVNLYLKQCMKNLNRLYMKYIASYLFIIFKRFL